MDMIQTLIAQMVMVMFFALVPMLNLMEARSNRNYPPGGGWGQ